jgi:YD repeat-containing protein
MNGLKQTFTVPDGTVYTYHYGTNNELRQVQIPGVGAVTIPDYTWNRPATVVYPGGTQRSFTYDALMRPASLTAADPGGNPLLEYAYMYDARGNIVRIADCPQMTLMTLIVYRRDADGQSVESEKSVIRSLLLGNDRGLQT